jgi:hypothetical protein
MLYKGPNNLKSYMTKFMTRLKGKIKSMKFKPIRTVNMGKIKSTKSKPISIVNI